MSSSYPQPLTAMAAPFLLLHNLFLKPFSSYPSSLFLKPLSSILHTHRPLSATIFTAHTHLFCTSITTSLTYPDTPSSPLPNPLSEYQEEQPKTPIKLSKTFSHPELPTLTVKERKELASYAHSLGKKLKVQQVGKSGVTSTSVAAFVENLESNELLKLKIHNNCPGELPDVVKQLEEETGSVVVGQIGRTVILYRPSLTKLLAEEKKKQAQKLALKKGFRRFKPTEQVQNNREAFRPSGRGRRGKDRFELP